MGLGGALRQPLRAHTQGPELGIKQHANMYMSLYDHMWASLLSYISLCHFISTRVSYITSDFEILGTKCGFCVAIPGEGGCTGPRRGRGCRWSRQQVSTVP